MVQNKLPLINSAHGSETRNIINELIKLFNGMGYTYNESLKMSREILENARQTNNMNQDVQKQINNLILSDGESDAEVIQARGSFDILKNRLDNIDKNLAERSVNIMNPPPPLVAAKGDGVTDDLGVIQNAIDYVASNGGGTVYFPAGEYLIGNTIEITGDNITVTGEGYGSHIHTINDLTAFVASGYDNLTWTNLRITGVRTTNAYNGYGSGIIVSNANKPRVENCFFENLMAKAVFYAGFHGAYGGNLDQGVHDGWVVNNHIDWCGDGIMVYNDGQRVEISGNMMFRCVNIGVYIDDSHQVQGEEIPRKSTRINVENNYFEDMMGTTSINLAGTDYSSARGNYIMYGGQSVVKNVNAISLQTVQNHVPTQHNIVEGNTIVGNSSIGIDLIGASFNIIRGNNLVNNSLNRSSGSAPAISLQSNTIREVTFGSSYNVVENNKSYVDSDDSTTPAHIRIRDEDCVDNIIRYNVLEGGLHSEPTLDLGTGTIQRENMFNGQMFHAGFLDGTFSKPAIHFNSDEGTGFYKVNDGDIGFSSNGTWAMRFSKGLQFRDGSNFQMGVGEGTRFGTSPSQKLAFWGRGPISQPENIPQTSGSTINELEQEVNKLKLLLRNVGLMGS